MDEFSSVDMYAEGTKYGNWMSLPAVGFFCLAFLIPLALFFVMLFAVKSLLLSILFALLSLMGLGMLLYALIIRRLFSVRGSDLMGKLHQELLRHLDWQGSGRVLDVGCGSGLLGIRCVKSFENAHVTGIDYWGPAWDYSQKLCSDNARLEGVSDKCVFKKGDANKLEFNDESFDALISNLVFHEVRNEKNKLKLLLESLRVLKKGGKFAIIDLFENKKLYGDMDRLIEGLKRAGVSDVHYDKDIKNLPFMPKIVRTPFMFNDIAILWGEK